jgi:hypothetical protein
VIIIKKNIKESIEIDRIYYPANYEIIVTYASSVRSYAKIYFDPKWKDYNFKTENSRSNGTLSEMTAELCSTVLNKRMSCITPYIKPTNICYLPQISKIIFFGRDTRRLKNVSDKKIEKSGGKIISVTLDNSLYNKLKKETL